MAWIDVTKAYDSVDHYRLCEMMVVHRFPIWIRKVVTKLCNSWNTKIVTTTKIGPEVSDVIHFNRGLPQGDSLCLRLFTICLNPVAWKLHVDSLNQSVPKSHIYLLYIDDLKVFAASTQKLRTVMKSTRTAIQDIGLEWNPKKCSVVNIKRGVKVADEQGMTFDESIVVKCLEEGSQCRVERESSRQEDEVTFKVASEVYLNRLSIIWSSPLSDSHRTLATNQYALPASTQYRT